MKKEKWKTFLWRMKDPCESCPFIPGPMRDSLRRLPEIEKELLGGSYFLCHKTTKETGNRTNLVCAGALDFQHARDVISDYERLCLSLEGVPESKKELFRRLKGLMRAKK